jgi:hypothetical protein
MNQEHGHGEKHFCYPQYATGAWLVASCNVRLG